MTMAIWETGIAVHMAVIAMASFLLLKVTAMLHQSRTMLLEDVLGKGLGIVDGETTDAFMKRGVGAHLGQRASGYY